MNSPAERPAPATDGASGPAPPAPHQQSLSTAPRRRAARDQSRRLAPDLPEHVLNDFLGAAWVACGAQGLGQHATGQAAVERTEGHFVLADGAVHQGSKHRVVSRAAGTAQATRPVSCSAVSNPLSSDPLPATRSSDSFTAASQCSPASPVSKLPGSMVGLRRAEARRAARRNGGAGFVVRCTTAPCGASRAGGLVDVAAFIVNAGSPIWRSARSAARAVPWRRSRSALHAGRGDRRCQTRAKAAPRCGRGDLPSAAGGCSTGRIQGSTALTSTPIQLWPHCRQSHSGMPWPPGSVHHQKSGADRAFRSRP